MKRIGLSILFFSIILLITEGCGNNGANSTIGAPTLQMGVPASLKYKDSPAASIYSISSADISFSIAQSTDDNGCPTLTSGEDYFANGYAMTRFLVIMSESRACYADLFISVVDSQLTGYINQGKIDLNTQDSSGLSAFQVDEANDTYDLWFWFDATNDAEFYMTWTKGSDSSFTGHFVNRYHEITDPVLATRFEFTRNTTLDQNDIYAEFKNDPSTDVDAFRAVVKKNTSGATITYEAKGLIGFVRQYATDLSASLTDLPSLSMVTTSSSAGEGAAIASYQDVGIRLKYDDTDGTSDFDLGTYRYTLTDKAYFGEDGITTWQHKGIDNANYADNTTRDTGVTPTVIDVCLETAVSCDGESINLGTDYFTNTCDETTDSDCQAFIQAVFDEGWMTTFDNSDTSEDSADWRFDYLNSATQLTDLWPGGTYDAIDFTVPSP